MRRKIEELGSRDEPAQCFDSLAQIRRRRPAPAPRQAADAPAKVPTKHCPFAANRGYMKPDGPSGSGCREVFTIA